jgi:hypothetical protein
VETAPAEIRHLSCASTPRACRHVGAGLQMAVYRGPRYPECVRDFLHSAHIRVMHGPSLGGPFAKTVCETDPKEML